MQYLLTYLLFLILIFFGAQTFAQHTNRNSDTTIVPSDSLHLKTDTTQSQPKKRKHKVKKQKSDASMVVDTVLIEKNNEFKPFHQIGLKAGYGWKSIYLNPIISLDLSLGGRAGICYRYFGEKWVGIQLEINYVQKGWKELPISSNVFEMNTAYIELPFTTQFQLGKKIGYGAGVGPNISYLVSQSKSFTQNDPDTEPLFYYGYGIHNRWDLGLEANLHILLNVGSTGKLLVQVNYTRALNNVYRTSADNLFISAQNHQIFLNLGYLLHFEKNKQNNILK